MLKNAPKTILSHYTTLSGWCFLMPSGSVPGIAASAPTDAVFFQKIITGGSKIEKNECFPQP
jgi:hypothetical protein